MENASKALIIAGAIIVSIVLISLGVYVLNMGSDAMKSADMSDTEIMAFNQQFLNFDGTCNGTKTKQLLDTVNSNNRKYSDDTSMCVKLILKEGESNDLFSDINSKTDGKDWIYSTSKIKTGYTYTVTFERDGASNRINQVNVSKK